MSLDPMWAELEKLLDVPFVFWMCPDRTHKGVTWNGAATIATCDICGNTNARNFPEDFSGENGAYMNKCGICGFQFYGHKRRVCCKLCQKPEVENAIGDEEHENATGDEEQTIP